MEHGTYYRTTVEYLDSESIVKDIIRAKEVRNEQNDIHNEDAVYNLDDVNTADSEAEVEDHFLNFLEALQSRKALDRGIVKERVLLNSNVVNIENEHSFI